jgi:serine/threonine protein kinase
LVVVVVVVRIKERLSAVLSTNLSHPPPPSSCFDGQYWGDSSPEAKDLISQMLTVDPKLRPSAKELLKHPWLQASAEVLRSKDLASTKVEMKKWAARRRLKAAVTSVVAIRRMTTLLGRR